MNIVCVLKQEAQSEKNKITYNKEWVEKLKNSIERNYKRPYKFFCLSNIDVGKGTIPLRHNWPGWWSKIELFRPDLFKGPVLYLDLDIIIYSNFERLVSSLDDHKFYMLEGQSKKGIPNSSMMYWSGDHSYIYTEFLNNTNKIKNNYRAGRKLGDQGFIFDSLKDVKFMNQLYPEYFSWKHQIPKHTKFLDTASFLIFIGKEKPINNLDLHIVKNNWG